MVSSGEKGRHLAASGGVVWKIEASGLEGELDKTADIKFASGTQLHTEVTVRNVNDNLSLRLTLSRTYVRL